MFGSSDKCVVFIMHSKDFEFKESLVTIPISLPLHRLDFVIDAFKFTGLYGSHTMRGLPICAP